MSLWTEFVATQQRRELTGRDLAWFFVKLIGFIALLIAFVIGWLSR